VRDDLCPRLPGGHTDQHDHGDDDYRQKDHQLDGPVDREIDQTERGADAVEDEHDLLLAKAALKQPRRAGAT